MRQLLPAITVITACVTTPVFAADTTNTGAAPLIERNALFGNPSQIEARLSPDGKWIAWIAPRAGALNIWVAPADHPAQGRALTAETQRPIQDYLWSPDSSSLLYLKDADGDENFLLYKVDVKGGNAQLLTPFKETRVSMVHVSKHVKNRILIDANNRDPHWHDIYSLDPGSGKLSKIFENTAGYASFVADETLTLRLAQKSRPDGGMDYYHIENGKVDAKPFASVGLEDSETTSPMWFTSDGKTLYWTDSRGRDTAALLAQDVATGKTTVLAENPKADISSSVLTDRKTGKVQAYSVDYLKTEWTALDPAIAQDLEFLKSQLKGNIEVLSRTAADDRWTVMADPVTAPSTTYLYDRTTRKLTSLFVSHPELAKATLAPMYPQEIVTRDGLSEVSYLTLPPGTDTAHPGRPDKPLPMVLLVHGGPWSRDSYGFNPEHQWLANRGYAVLSVNFRGSVGFGKKFVSAGDLQWGAKMHDDLLDAVRWAINNKVAEPDKIGIMGASYGGYATLVGMSFTPDTFACGVDIVGPSNMATLLETIPPYWDSGKGQMYQRMGDPTTAHGRQLLHDRSPLFKADAIRKPLLIVQGANDPRVKQAEADQIVEAMAARNIPVTYVLFPDEGHNFERPENRIAFYAVTEEFLGQCLGGRKEPIGDALKASTATVPHGEAFVPGLQQALATKR